MRPNEFKNFHQRFPQKHSPPFGRRAFFQAMSGLAGSLLLPAISTAATESRGATTIGKAKNLIFILMSGGPSHVDTFDLKSIDGVTPLALGPERISGLLWPAGIFPKLASQLDSIAILRSMRAWALVHETGQQWVQIGRNPAGAEGSIAPHMGSIIAREKAKDRRGADSFPPFLALDVNEAVGEGYFAARYAPFKYVPGPGGIPDTLHRDGEATFQLRLKARASLEGRLRDPNFEDFYDAARAMMYNPLVDWAFRYDPMESERYGSTPFGNACLVARQVLSQDLGTRAIMIRLGGWDSHSNIYSTTAPTSLFNSAKTLDNGLAALLTDLKSIGLFEETLIVAGGEFGRSTGPLTAAQGRDHHLQQSFLMMGAGIRGGRAIGSTDANGDFSAEYGWSRDRDIRTEDVEATIYSALGIDWTTVLNDSPLGAFPYIPHSDKDLYGPIHELWS